MKPIKISKQALADIEYAARQYTLTTQARQCMEECAELIVALNKYLRGSHVGIHGRPVKKPPFKLFDDVAEEMADVIVMIHELCWLFEAEDEVSDMIERKAAREAERAGKGRNDEVQQNS